MNQENQVYICEYCGKEHDGSYGSGRFCSYSCKQKFSSSKQDYESRKKIQACPYCKTLVYSTKELRSHFTICNYKNHVKGRKNSNKVYSREVS